MLSYPCLVCDSRTAQNVCDSRTAQNVSSPPPPNTHTLIFLSFLSLFVRLCQRKMWKYHTLCCIYFCSFPKQIGKNQPRCPQWYKTKQRKTVTWIKFLSPKQLPYFQDLCCPWGFYFLTNFLTKIMINFGKILRVCDKLLPCLMLLIWSVSFLEPQVSYLNVLAIKKKKKVF